MSERKTKRSKRKNQYPAYALKSDDGAERPKNQYLAYALKSDDGKKNRRRTNIQPMPLKATMANLKNAETQD